MLIENAANAAHEAGIRTLAEFVGAVRVRYTDHDLGETYQFWKADGSSLLLRVCGNRVDGGFLGVPKVFPAQEGPARG